MNSAIFRSKTKHKNTQMAGGVRRRSTHERSREKIVMTGSASRRRFLKHMTALGAAGGVSAALAASAHADGQPDGGRRLAQAPPQPSSAPAAAAARGRPPGPPPTPPRP